MGGCRCSFRDCPVASERNKGMHFFRYPLKDTERCQSWAKMAGLKAFNVGDVQLWNKVVCGRHFHDTNFMNYKHDRLTMSAIPTLHRINDEYALDYSNDVNNPVLMKLPPITRPHLVPPNGYPDTMHFTAVDRKLADKIMQNFENNTDDKMMNVVTAPKRRQSCPIKIQESKKLKLVRKKDSSVHNLMIVEEDDNSLLLNESLSCSNDFLETGTVLEIIDVDEMKTLQKVSKKPNEGTLSDEFLKLQHMNDKTATQSKMQSLDVTSKINKDEYLKKVKDKLSKESQRLEKTKNALVKSEEIISKLNTQIKELIFANEQLKTQLSINEKQYKETKSELADLASEHEILQQQHNELEFIYTDTQKQHKEQVSLLNSTSQQQQSQPQQQQQPQLTKIQLFHGIKKYLSQTMVALLRIQLSSGSSEREWKPDERRLAVDLMELGEKVYKYFTDEWLIRLPPLRQVQLWRADVGAVDEEDDI